VFGLPWPVVGVATVFRGEGGCGNGVDRATWTGQDGEGDSSHAGTVR
jgi:hypothetical protein